ncbi:MAG: N-carbamoyl-D-amino-acid hydrolase [Elsteraceae bacterium]
MARLLTVAAAQVGPIQRAHTRAQVVERLIALMTQAWRRGAELVVFPELTLTTFFPRWWMTDQAEIDQFFEKEMPGPETQPLFDAARRMGIGFHLGFAELTVENGRTRRYNTAILVDSGGREIGRYRKVHLPGHAEHEPWRAFQHLEKRYFEMPDATDGPGFKTWRAFGGIVGMCICNDRRWPETWRSLGLQGAELVMAGYNTPLHNPPAPDHDALSLFHNALSFQAGSYQNGCWSIGVAKAGVEEGCMLIGGSLIVAPSGEIVAQAQSVDDEVVVATIDLDRCKSYKSTTFNFAVHRQPQHYGLVVERKGSIDPA